MGNENTANRLLKVSELREKQAKNTLGQAQAAVVTAEAALASYITKRDDAHERVRQAMNEGKAISELEWMSQALLAEERMIEQARTKLEEARKTLKDALAVFSQMSRQRLTAEKYRDRLRLERLKEWSQKEDRVASDRAASRPNPADTTSRDE